MTKNSLLLCSVALVFPVTLTAANATEIASGTVETTQQSVGGTDTLTIDAGGALSVDDTAIKWNSASTDLQITNDGTIESVESDGRAINAGGSVTSPRVLTLVNGANGIIRSESDAIRINTDVTDTAADSIVIRNLGMIVSTVDGQALDFDAIASAGDGTVRIDNLAGGTIQSTDADALRPGQGAVINNAGTIYAGKVTNDSSDGVDFQGHSGTVNNLAGGVISGARHGITTDTDVTVINYGTITGRNGSGVGSDGSGTIINYGRITGAYDGSGNGDGDGVDLDTGGSVENFGVIEALGAAGVTSGGETAGSDGVTIGGAGGTVINHAGATIYSVGGAVPIAQGTVINDGTITGGSVGIIWGGATTVENTGTITGGVAGVYGGNAGDTLVNSGTISGPTAISMGGGDDQLTLLPGSVLDGTVDGGDGYDRITLGGAGDGSFAGAVNFEHLEVASGSWTLTGAGTYSDGSTIDAAASLTASSDILTGTIDDSGTLTIDQPTDGTFTATLTGTGQFVKAGAGVLTIGDQAFTGATRVSGGTLLVTGGIASAVTVGTGGILAGTGTIAAATVESGGQIVPGANGIGTLTISGDFLQKAGSVYAAQVGADGTADLLQIGGKATIEPGAGISVAMAAGEGTIGKRYVLLSAAGGISGDYTQTEAVTAGTELRYDSNGTVLSVVVARNAEGLVLAANPGDAGVAAVIGALGAGTTFYDALTLDPDADEVRRAFSQLGGGVHASVRTGMIQDALLVDDAMRTRLDNLGETGAGIWGHFVGGHAQDDGSYRQADADRDVLGFLGGFDVALGQGVHAGIAGGYTRTRLTLDGSSARVHGGHLIGYAGADLAAFRIRGAIGYAWNSLSTARNLSFDGFTDNDAAHYHGHVWHGFGEVGYSLGFGAGTVEPFVRGTAVHVHTDDFSESGGVAALDGADHGNTATFSDVGVHFAMPLAETLSVQASASWQHAYGRVNSTALLAFENGGAPFVATGTALSRDAVSPSVDLSWAIEPSLRLSAGYAGLFGSNSRSNVGRVMLSFGF